METVMETARVPASDQPKHIDGPGPTEIAGRGRLPLAR